METYTTGTGQKLRVHDRVACNGMACAIHHPSSHCMRDFPTHWREDRYMMERICPHGIGHPDPDDKSLFKEHGCDGCCSATKELS